jgi:hypothetical protein
MATTKKKASATMETVDGTKSIPIAEVLHENPNLPAIISPEEKAKKEIARYEVARKWIAGKKKELDLLKTKDTKDKGVLSAVKTLWQEVRGKRLAVAEKHKEIKADYLVITRAVDGEKNELTKLLEEVEEPAKEILEADEKAKQAERERIELEEQQKLQGRIAELLANGMAFNGSYYAIGETISMDVVALKGMTDEGYTVFLTRVKNENQILIDAKAKKEADEQAERDRMEQQRKDQEEAAKKLQQQQEEIQRQQEELKKQQEEIVKQRTQSRASALEGLGMSYNYGGFCWNYGTFDHGRVTITKDFVETAAGADWEEQYLNMRLLIKELNEKQAATDKQRDELKKAQEEQRQADEKATALKAERAKGRIEVLKSVYGMQLEKNQYCRRFKHYDKMGVFVLLSSINDFDDTEWADLITKTHAAFVQMANDEQAETERLQKEAEAARTAALSDVQRLREFISTFSADNGEPEPEIENEELRRAYESFTEAIATAVDTLAETLDRYEAQ